jgi:hypothetical protein
VDVRWWYLGDGKAAVIDPSTCLRCGERIDQREGDRPVLGYAYDVDSAGVRIDGSESMFGAFHKDCWEQVKRSLDGQAQGE